MHEAYLRLAGNENAAWESRAWGLGRDEDPVSVRLECLSGILPIDLRPTDAGAEIQMGLPRPRVSALAGYPEMVTMLGIQEGAVSPDLPALVGPPTMLVPIKSFDALAGVRPDRQAVRRPTTERGCDGLILATLDTVDERSAVHVRMFAPAAGVDEDPVTGSAQALTAEWLARTGDLSGGDGTVVSYVAEQGDCVGRPCRIRVEANLDGERAGSGIRHVSIAGWGVTVMDGEMTLPAPGR